MLLVHIHTGGWGCGCVAIGEAKKDTEEAEEAEFNELSVDPRDTCVCARVCVCV